MGLLWRFGKHKHLLPCWELGWQISAHSMGFLKGWNVQPRDVEFGMRTLPDFYLQQFQGWEQPSGERQPLLSEQPINFSTFPSPAIKMSLPCASDIALAPQVPPALCIVPFHLLGWEPREVWSLFPGCIQTPSGHGPG